MELHLSSEMLIYENSVKNIDILIQKINEDLEKNKLYFSHLIINGKEVYSDFEEQIMEQINTIEKIELVTKTIDEFINDLTVSLNEYSNRAIPSIKQLTEQFYQSPTEESWGMLQDLLEGLNWMYSTIKSMGNTELNEYKEKLLNVANHFEVELPNLLDAIESHDYILIGDIISYEILPQFESIGSITEETFQVINK
ncbi:Uncharacterised protein [Niallia circulans]|uniref:hypothetical protein n=2 Tax=Niallia circulans TaxID=1397 RepID=UPI00077C0EFC|nr:hypothetical protein [Niallia circulans]MDR4316315.1 hypothetical protein [Niallia circulans]MED3838515.1 hypothetical protein [Niallia circulans]MED4243988.1 hypothetical protein [Niallia circulans]MED4246382.1 hypothetical protein [Niallia circulans]NRG33212.1 hypothetical protein [Niallia circulans]